MCNAKCHPRIYYCILIVINYLSLITIDIEFYYVLIFQLISNGSSAFKLNSYCSPINKEFRQNILMNIGTLLGCLRTGIPKKISRVHAFWYQFNF